MLTVDFKFASLCQYRFCAKHSAELPKPRGCDGYESSDSMCGPIPNGDEIFEVLDHGLFQGEKAYTGLLMSSSRACQCCQWKDTTTSSLQKIGRERHTLALRTVGIPTKSAKTNLTQNDLCRDCPIPAPFAFVGGRPLATMGGS